MKHRLQTPHHAPFAYPPPGTLPEKAATFQTCRFDSRIDLRTIRICCERLQTKPFNNIYGKQEGGAQPAKAEGAPEQLASPVCYANSPEIRPDFADPCSLKGL